MRYHVQHDYLKCSVAQAQVKTGVYRSKVAQTPDIIPAAPITLRAQLRLEAAAKAWRALHRHGEKSYQYLKALRSRWFAALAAGES